MRIKEASYNGLECKGVRRPFLMGCSGGGGHISAIKGIYDYLNNKYHRDEIDLPLHEPVLLEEKGSSPSRELILKGQGWLWEYRISPLVKKVSALTPLPIIPSRESLIVETSKLNANEKKLKLSKRCYRDMLLDYYDAGYESAGIWNILQRQDAVVELKKLIALQKNNDNNNYSLVKQRLLDDFKKAAQEGKPYTEIISTQAMGLPALCDAVIEYNQWSRVQHPAFTPLVIHQYFTDLPTHGAIHFFNPLSCLSKKQQQQMHLYGLGMSEDVIRTFFPKGEDFGGIYDIPPKDNPMVRPGFTDPDLDYSKFFHKSCKFYLLDSDNEKQDYRITADEQIATILLGSQASNDTVKYIETLLKNGYQKIFVLGGHLFEKEIQEIESRYPQLPNRIVRVSSNQTDTTLTPLLTRSNIIIQRGGGVSVMEAMAMPHNPEQAILIHHTDAHADEIKEKELTSGISWEDCNVDRLVTALSQKGLRTKKTSPELAKSEIPRARLSAALVLLDKSFKTKLAAIQSKSFSHNSSLKRQLMKEASALQKGIKLAASFRQRLSFFNRFILEDFVALLSHPLIKEEPQRLLPLMSAYESCTTQQSSANWEIVLNSLLSENRLTSSWLTKLSHPEANEPFLSREVHRCIILRMMELKESLPEDERPVAARILADIHERAAENDFKGLKEKLKSTEPPKAYTNPELKKFFTLSHRLAARMQTPSDMQELNSFLLNPHRVKETGEAKSKLLTAAQELEEALRIYLNGMKESLSDYSIDRLRFFSPRYMFHSKLMNEKLEIAETLLGRLTRLNKQEFTDNTRAVAMTKLLVSAQKANEKVVRHALFASNGRLGDLLNSHVNFLNTNYSLAYKQGYSQLNSKTPSFSPSC